MNFEKKKIFCQIGIVCQFIEKYPPLKKMESLSKKFSYPPPPPPPPTRPDHTRLPQTPPTFFRIWIICQLESVLVNFFTNWQRIQIKKNVFLGAGGGGGRCGGVGGWG